MKTVLRPHPHLKFCLLVLLTGIFGFAAAQPAQIPALLSDGKSLDASAHEEEALQKFLQVLQIDPGNYEATWNASYLYSRIGSRFSDIEKKKEYYNLAKKYAADALRLNAKDAEANYVMAAAMGRMALVSPAKEKVAASRDIKKYAELAIQYNPAHAGAYYILGKWNYEVANLNWAEKGAANLLFGGIPEGSLDNAIKNYLVAIKLDPDFILYYLELARALDQKQFYAEETRVLNKALSLTPHAQDDPARLAQCRDLLSKVKK